MLNPTCVACLSAMAGGILVAGSLRAESIGSDFPGELTEAKTNSNAQFGEPITGLTPAEMVEFLEGLVAFTTEKTPADGLGPIFNNHEASCEPSVSCMTCHSVPAVGGVFAFTEIKFGQVIDGTFDPLTELGGINLQVCAIDPSCQETNPVVNLPNGVTGLRLVTPLFGAGLLEAIPDEAIIRNARTPKSFGIGGHPAYVTDVVSGQTRVGRFGAKAQQATLTSFAADASLNEMGITTRIFPLENTPNGPLTAYPNAPCDLVPDPEDAPDSLGKSNFDRIAMFIRCLAPPPPLPMTASARYGSGIFRNIGCADCHKPLMVTGTNSIAALDHKPVRAYSDLLVHDMGTLGDGIAQGGAGRFEMRTAPLWGLRTRPLLLHDGSATTAQEAILRHDGEGAGARNNFLQLKETERQSLLEYLNSL